MGEGIRGALRRVSNELGLGFLGRRRAAWAGAVLTMALALAANTLVASVYGAFLRSSFGLPDPDRVVVISPVRELPGRGEVPFAEAWPNVELIRETQRSFSHVAALVQLTVGWDDGAESRPLPAARVTADFFATTGVAPALGRTFLEEDEGPSPAPVALVSHAFWREALAGDPAAVGGTLVLDGVPHQVLGVMPPGFAHPLPTDVWLPFDLPERLRATITGGRILGVYGRLGEGVPRRRALAYMDELTRRAIAASPDNRGFHYQLRTFTQVLLPGADRTVRLIQAGALVLILLAVLNLASLLVAWGLDRRQEMALRLALGAGRRRVARLLLLQGVGVVAAGAAGGLTLAAAALPLLRSLEVAPALALFMANLELDPGVLARSVAVALGAGLLAGALPARLGLRGDTADPLRSGSRGASLAPAAVRWQKGLVVGQATLTVVLLAGAVLVGVSLRRLAAVPDGFAPGDKVAVRVQLPGSSYGTQGERAALAARLEAALAAEPELLAHGFSTTLPVGDVPWGGRFFADPADADLAEEPMLLHFRRVSPGYHAVMGIPVLRGRAFDARDDGDHPMVALVSGTLADRLWPGEEAVGRPLFRVIPGAEPERLEVVGVVGDVMDGGYAAPPGEAVYVPFAQQSIGRMSIVVQPRSGEAAAVAAVRRAVREADPLLAAGDVASLRALVTRANALPRLQTILLAAFAVVGAGIVALGSYGVMSQLVAIREPELATRLALGAQPKGLAATVLAQAARLAVPGAVAGVAAAQLLGGLLAPFVFGVDPRSVPVTVLVALATVALVGVATLPAARRAMRVTPGPGARR